MWGLSNLADKQSSLDYWVSGEEKQSSGEEQDDGEHRLYRRGIMKASFMIPREALRGGSLRQTQASLVSAAAVEAMLAIALLP